MAEERVPTPEPERGPRHYEPPASRRKRRIVRGAVAAAAVLAAAAAVLAWHFAGRVSTDDAQVDGHVSPVAARVGGTVMSVAVNDNESVAAGALLVKIDPKDAEVAVRRAEADLAEAEAAAAGARTSVPMTGTTSSSQLQEASSGLGTARAKAAAARARLAEAQANDTKAQQDLGRMRTLVAKEEVSRQEYDAAVAAAAAARAALESARAGATQYESEVAAAQARVAHAQTGPQQVEIARSRADSAAARVATARAALERARLDLSYTRVTAPAAGVVSRRTVEVGQVVQPGQPLLAIVSLDDVWVTANYKESQLRKVRPGQRVGVKVDAYGGRKYRAHVDSIAAATGARFSLLPPENATGNFVKVVQRIPVKIVFDEKSDPAHPLRPGMSVVPTIFVR